VNNLFPLFRSFNALNFYELKKMESSSGDFINNPVLRLNQALFFEQGTVSISFTRAAAAAAI
jgi:hypothetical protein